MRYSWTGANFVHLMELYEEIGQLIPVGAYDRASQLAEELQIQANTVARKSHMIEDSQAERQAKEFSWFGRDVVQTINRGNYAHLRDLKVDLFLKEVKRPRFLRMRANVRDRFLTEKCLQEDSDRNRQK